MVETVQWPLYLPQTVGLTTKGVIMCESGCWCGDDHTDDYVEWAYHIGMLETAVKSGIALTKEMYDAACKAYDDAHSLTYGMGHAASFERVMDKYLLKFQPWNK